MIRQLQMFNTPINTLLACLLVCWLARAHAAEKWSRQLEPTSPGVSDSFDWVPVAQPVDSSTAKDRSANARVLTYSQAYPPNGRFGDLPKPHNPPVSQQQPFDFPYQFQRFANQPPPRSQVGSPFGAPPLKAAAPAASSLQSGEPTSQSFFKFEMPFRTEGGSHGASGSPGSLQTGYQIQHILGGGAQATLFSSPLFNQQPVFPPEFHPIPQKPLQQTLQKPLPQQNYIEDSFPSKNVYRESKPNPTQQSLQSVTPQVFPVEQQVDQFFDLNKPSSFNAQLPFQHTDSAPTAPYQQSGSAPTAPASLPTSNGGSQQDVQLLYVPYDTLFNQQKPESQGFELNKYNVNAGLPTVNPFQINQFYTQDSLDSLDQQNYFASSITTSTSRPKTTTLKPTTIFQNYANQQPTTPRPKPKAHQPPLAMFLVRNSVRPTQTDVVSALRHSNTIAVIDAPTKKIPEIFVGPAGMSTPDGYVKFDLPYLSQLAQTRELREIPFFVAPLSYRTPSGFNKILLPEPHVGSIVINLAKSSSAPQAVLSQPAKPSAVYSQNDISQYQSPPPTQRVRPHRVKQPSATKDYYPAAVLNEPVHKNRDQYEITTQRSTLPPTRGNKFNYFYNQDAIHEVSSPKVTKHDRPKKKRPQNVQQQPIEQPAFPQTINNPYAQFQPAPNQITNDDIYKVQSSRPSPSTSPSTSTTTTTTSTTSTTAAPAQTFYSFNPNGQVEFQSANGPLYSFDTIPKEPVEEQAPRFTTRPPSSTSPEEEYHMKQYYRQQEAFRNRPQIVSPTNPPFEQVQYTPVDLDYGRDVNAPSTTHKTTSPTKQRVTFYSPSQPGSSAPEDAYNVVQQPDFAELQQEKVIEGELKPQRKQPSNHRPLYNQNEIPDSTVEYDPNPYHVPSELPPLTPNLPGLVNNLQEKDKQNAIGELATTTPSEPEKELPTRPTRRPINRVRKPLVSKVTSSVSYSETETSTRRPIQRVRRPFGARATASTPASPDGEEEATSTTRRPSSAARNPLIRNPNRIRYQPTPEERQSLRTKQRKKYGNSGKDEDLDYQRDVLKQNYPVIKPLSSRTPSSPTAIPSSYATNSGSEAPTSETQQVYTVTPSNTVGTNEQTFPAGMLEPMQIAQQYSQYTKDNFGPGYFPNQEDLGPTEPIIRNEINPVFTTLPTTTPTPTTTTTSEEPQVTTRRSPFIRRNYPRLRTTTTEAPTTTTQEAETKTSLRPRLPPRKVIKVRTRTRRPVSSTTNPEEEAEVEEPKSNVRKINRFNHDLYENDATPPQRRRHRPSFQLDGQESQWSPALKFGNNHHFKPTNPKEKSKENEHKFDEEPEIVTIGPEDDKKSDNYEVNVSASFGEAKPTLKAPNLKPEKSFAELLEEVMGKAPEEKPLESVEETSTRTTDGTFFESQKTTIFNRINRRNKFKKLHLPTTQNNESFETAESQSLGSQLYNSLHGNEKSTDEIVNELKTTTPLTPAPGGKITTTTLTTTTASPSSTVYTEEPTTPDQLEVTSYATTLAMDEALDKTTIAPAENEAESVTAESATRRMDEAVDDLESQPSIFSEVKRQLHDLFAIDESEDHAVTAALAAVGKRRQEYMNIKRTKPDTTTQAMNVAAVAAATTVPTPSVAAETAAADKKPLQKSLMDQVVYATSTSTKVTSETEICYRGRCIRSEDLPSNHKLQ
ncbi:mucin-5AC [Rhagoletis pomonella]|uniref:mucin-5AC n=1 Tax=Rhagoletis pomonella TaxID=28610 RepID=UPI00177CED4A|nr:mucin-5AC [Rhagoletis pomonella]XP_036331395.1 mucin-5AC [Rhagoletis pomonella]